jgi:hypothetical protein
MSTRRVGFDSEARLARSGYFPSSPRRREETESRTRTSTNSTYLQVYRLHTVILSGTLDPTRNPYTLYYHLLLKLLFQAWISSRRNPVCWRNLNPEGLDGKQTRSSLPLSPNPFSVPTLASAIRDSRNIFINTQ